MDVSPVPYNARAMLTRYTPGLAFAGDADTDRFLQREWLLTNAAGGFAMGTARGVNTRRYHALFIAAAKPPVDRVVVLHHLVETLTLHHGNGTTTSLEFGPLLFEDDAGQLVLAPDDTELFRRFDHLPAAIWSYEHEGLSFTRRLVLHGDEQACTVHYDLFGLHHACERATLTLRPFITLRGFHGLEHEHDASDTFDTESTGDTLRVDRGGREACYRLADGTVADDPQWWRGVRYPIEERRGQGVGEDLFGPATFTVELDASADAAACFTAALGGQSAEPVSTATGRLERVNRMLRELGGGLPRTGVDPLLAAREAAALAFAADDFIVKRTVAGKPLSTVIAGYPWFADWGRDTFIALPGLLLCTGRHGEARDTLAAFAEAMRGGLVPNRFDDDDPTAAHYNTVDASLWFVHSALEYVRHSGDEAAWDGWLAEACLAVVAGYRDGTHADAHDGGGAVPIGMDADGLIAAGDPTSQLTWMDAAATGPDGAMHVFTPRPGKCVEINGLWYSALARLAQQLPDRFKAERGGCAELAKRVLESFSRVFWPADAGEGAHLIDHVAPDGEGGWVADASLRPNMLIACALEHSPAKRAHRAASIAAAEAKLLTPVGLRTLPRTDPEYHARYEGDAFTRDGAYHRGVVWPWLIGPYAEAVLREGGFGAEAKDRVRAAIAPLIERLTTERHPGMLGQLHEIHEPEPPFAPRGCPAQAWSVAEVLRVWCMLHRDERKHA